MGFYYPCRVVHGGWFSLWFELENTLGLEDEKQSIGASGNQKMASGLISVSLKCIGASMGEKPVLVKKLPATTTVGKLKNLCESFFKLKSVKPILFLQEEGSPIPTLLNDDMESLMELGIVLVIGKVMCTTAAVLGGKTLLSNDSNIRENNESFYTASWACTIDGTPFLVAGGLNGIICVIDTGSEKIYKISGYRS
ncbi:tubulin-folding cofactor E-like isoform X2 [Henckelia pumila]|uniref:tubulin-folding cofactor E-like isoform X2 n=1 Tax=Henckelia pumila TaxID=405737 RepID=UPI003C6E8973